MSNLAIKAASSLDENEIVPLFEATTLQHTTTSASQAPASKPASPRTAKPVANFQYRGKVWRIFKRRNHTPDEIARRLAGPPWQLYFEHQGKRNLWSCEFGEKGAAIAKAKAMLDDHFDGQQTVRKPLKTETTLTLGQVFAAVHDIPCMEASKKSRESYVWGTRYLFKMALNLSDNEDVDKLRLSVLDAEHGRKIFGAVRQRLGQCATQADANRFRRNVLAAWTCVHALFCQAAVESLEKDLGIRVPATVAAFRSARKLAKFQAKSTTEFAAPDASLLRRSFRAWLRVGRTGAMTEYKISRKRRPMTEPERRNMFLSMGLMISCGLRKGEVRQIRWRHMTKDVAGVPYLSTRGDVDVKNHSAEIHVRPIDPFWRLMLRIARDNGWIGAPDDYVLTCRESKGELVPFYGVVDYHSDRTYWPFWFAGKFLRALGWRLQKTNHALRDCAGSLVTMKYGLTRAKIFLRHKSVVTTESHYGRFVNAEMMDNPNFLKWLKWAI